MNIKLPIGKIFIYALINMFSLVLVATGIMAIVISLIFFTTGGKEEVIKYMNKEVLALLSYIPLISFIFTLTHFPVLLYEYHSIRKMITKLDYTVVKIDYQKVHFKKSQANYTIKMLGGKCPTYSLSSEDGKINTQIDYLSNLEKFLSQLEKQKIPF